MDMSIREIEEDIHSMLKLSASKQTSANSLPNKGPLAAKNRNTKVNHPHHELAAGEWPALEAAQPPHGSPYHRGARTSPGIRTQGLSSISAHPIGQKNTADSTSDGGRTKDGKKQKKRKNMRQTPVAGQYVPTSKPQSASRIYEVTNSKFLPACTGPSCTVNTSGCTMSSRTIDSGDKRNRAVVTLACSKQPSQSGDNVDITTSNFMQQEKSTSDEISCKGTSPDTNDGLLRLFDLTENSQSTGDKVRVESVANDGKIITSSVMNTKMPQSEGKNTSPLGITAEEQQLNEQFEADYIYLLKKKSPKIPSAKYFCRLCDYHCTSVEHCRKHMKEARHKRLKSIKIQDELLRSMPPPSENHAEALSQAVETLCCRIAASDVNYQQREVAFNRFQQAIGQISTVESVFGYGSSLSRLALADSDLNITVQSTEAARTLLDIFDVLNRDKSGHFLGVTSDFTSKMPVITALVPCSIGNVNLHITVNNTMALETSKLLAVYAMIDPRVQHLVVTFKYWAKLCKVDRQSEGSLPAYVYTLIVIYFLQQCSPPVLPVLHELLTDEERHSVAQRDSSPELVYINDIARIRERWHCENNLSIGQLWIELLKFVCFNIDMSEVVVCIRQKAVLTRNEKKWTSKKLAVEDPFYRRRNVARSISHGQIYEYIDECLRRAFLYFGMLPSCRSSYLAGGGEPSPAPTCSSDDDTLVTADDFAFDENILANKKGPPMICSICQKQGHLKRNCPQDILPPLLPIPPPPKQHVNMLNRFLTKVPADFEPRDRELRERNIVLAELLAIVRQIYPTANLCLFGSSCNGFGFYRSDLDITLTFEDHETDEGLDCIEIIEKLAKLFKKQRSLYNILAITSAKVPIVKFKHRKSQLEGDISLYNTLAQHNTRMLQTYAQIDDRVRSLGYIMKVFAKCADIGDASRGSLSSYAYILMVIYFLQQRKPPVIPVLQQLYSGQKSPQCIVDKWNAWFFEDLKNLHRVWSGLNKNHESVAELWIGLLKFYTEEFHMDTHVVSIRQLQPLTKFEKLWNGFGISIEDPFNLDHNLGSGVSRKMNVFIQKVLRNGRLLFSTPLSLPRLPERYQTIQDYYFDTYLLTEGANPPNDRGCRRCGKIGHFVNECPLLNKSPKKGNDKSTEKSDSEDKPDVEEMSVGGPAESLPLESSDSHVVRPEVLPNRAAAVLSASPPVCHDSPKTAATPAQPAALPVGSQVLMVNGLPYVYVPNPVVPTSQLFYTNPRLAAAAPAANEVQLQQNGPLIPLLMPLHPHLIAQNYPPNLIQFGPSNVASSQTQSLATIGLSSTATSHTLAGTQPVIPISLVNSSLTNQQPFLTQPLIPIGPANAAASLTSAAPQPASPVGLMNAVTYQKHTTLVSHSDHGSLLDDVS